MFNRDPINLVILISGVFITFFGIIVYFIVFPLMKKIGEKELEILKKKKEINSLPKRILQRLKGEADQKQFEKIVKKEKEPLLQELDILQTQRQFLLDKLPFLSFFKK